MACNASEPEQGDERAREGAMTTSFPCAAVQVVGKQQQPATRASAMGQHRADIHNVRVSCSAYRSSGPADEHGGWAGRCAGMDTAPRAPAAFPSSSLWGEATPQFYF